MKTLSHSFKLPKQGRSLVPILLLVGAIGLAGAWLYRHSAPPKPPTLSKASLAALARLSAPIEIRFYSGLGSATNTPSLPVFEEYTRRLLRAYHTAAPDKVSIQELQITNNTSANQAITDGIRPFNLEKGDASFLGVVVQAGNHKEVLPMISPDYEAALEADVTRAILRTEDARTGGQPVAQSDTTPDASTIEKVKTLVPNYSTVSLKEGTATLQKNMLDDLQKAGADLEVKMKEANEAYAKAEASGNKAEMESARKAITAAEIAHDENLKKIIANSTSQIRALRQLKDGNPVN